MRITARHTTRHRNPTDPLNPPDPPESAGRPEGPGRQTPEPSRAPASRRRGALRLAAFGALAGLLGACAEGDPEPAEESSAEQPEQSESASPSESADSTDGSSEAPQDETSEDPGAAEETESAQESPLDQQGVSAAHPEAVAAGESVLEQGGNAVDAAIATALAVSVVEPYASGLGGGGSALIAGGEAGDPEFYDYREEVAAGGDIPDSGTGVPGFAAGLGELHAAHGSMEWEELVEPARTLAADGTEVSDFLHTRMTEDLGPEAIEDESEFAPGGDPLSAGDTLVQEDLAGTLQTLAEEGWESFYTGEIADRLTRVDGLDAQTLADYEVRQSEPVGGEFGDYRLLSAAPALPGPALIQMVQDAEEAGIAGAAPDSGDYVRTLSEAWLDAEETVQTELGDPEFVDVPLDDIIGPAAAETAATAGDDAESAAADDAAAAAAPDAPNTTHISVVDEDGTVVSMTNTLTNFWGSGDTTAGFFLNNQLSRFDAIDSEANRPEPGKRSVTWSTPSIVLDAQDRPVLAIGTPGGHQILNVLGTVLTRWGLQDASLEEAIAALRYRLDGETDTLFVEEQPDGELAEAIAEAGWTTQVWPRDVAAFGSVQALEIDYATGEVSGAEDPRREGTFAILP